MIFAAKRGLSNSVVKYRGTKSLEEKSKKVCTISRKMHVRRSEKIAKTQPDKYALNDSND